MERVPIPVAMGAGRFLFAPHYADAQEKLRGTECLVVVLDWTAARCPDAATWTALRQLGSTRFDPYALPPEALAGPVPAGRQRLTDHD